MTPGPAASVMSACNSNAARLPCQPCLMPHGEPSTEAAIVHPHDDELTAVAWTSRQEWTDRLAPHLARRITACADAANANQTVYLQNGRPLKDTNG
ncbi:hypothetical protein GCM10023194_40660 [Planotetraspora phitsanulokensis]|uniref:Uncharacterized protein n=2 Tax=Planotetraspora phitsanulokensis TaxID=575192 RepID=A0A8J3UAD9_9ACTN|nr:hypothetical protein Pph01_59490 [Planotetraspora phitsanulokensis]